MSSKDRVHFLNDRQAGNDAPKHLTKEEFGRRLFNLATDRGWRQSDLARRADVNRASISAYVNGKMWPAPLTLRKLADALGVEPEALLPNAAHDAILRDDVSFEMKSSAAAPGKSWVKLNRLMSMAAAQKIAQIIAEDVDAA